MITAVVSGSFKFKPEIDKTIDTFEETGIKVLEPTKGWLIMPTHEITERINYGLIRPLPTEEKLTTKQIEDRFLKALARASLMYIMNPEGYMGVSTSLEIGYALSLNKPIYSFERVTFIEDINSSNIINDAVTILPPENVVAHFIENYAS